MEINTFKSAEEFENAKSILGMCYDSLTQIQENMFIVTLGGQQGLIDIDNKTLLDFQDNKIIPVGKSVFIADKSLHKRLDLNTLQLSDTYIHTIKKCGNAAIIEVLGEGYGILGSDGEYIMPPIYNNILINNVRATGVNIWVMLKDHNFISNVSADGLRVSKLDEKETKDPSIRIVSTKFKKTGRDKYKLYYEVAKNYDLITNNDYDDLMYKTAYVPFGLIHTWKNQFAGLIRSNGKTIVPPDRFKSVDSIGYGGLCIVGEKNKSGKILLGVYKEDKGLIVNCLFEDKITKTDMQITYFYRYIDTSGQPEWWILGNDGYVKKELVEAFPISRLNIQGKDACKINVYGRDYIVNSQLQVITGMNYDDAYWVRMN